MNLGKGDLERYLARLHERLRTPLAGVDRMTNLLLEDPGLGAARREQVEAISEYVDRLLRTLNEARDALALDALGPPVNEVSPQDKALLLAKRGLLLEAMFSRGLSSLENDELETIESQLGEIETREADDFDRGYPESRAGKIEAALDRLERSMRTDQSRPPHPSAKQARHKIA